MSATTGWAIESGPLAQKAPDRDGQVFFYVIGNRAAPNSRDSVEVRFSGSALASGTEALPPQVVEAIADQGRAAVNRFLAEGPPPRIIEVGTAGVLARRSGQPASSA